MLKNKNILIISILLVSILLNIFITTVSAVNTTQLEIVQKASETKYLENDQGYISKNIVDSNSNTGEVTVELKLSNTKRAEETTVKTEVMLVIDNSPSMDFVTESGLTRKEIVIPAAKTLVDKLFDNSSSLKIGVVKFNGGYSVSSASTLMCSLTDDKNKILNTLDTLNSQSTTSGTNILAGITRANNSFSSDCQNKIIVLLTDGVPNYDLSSYSGNDTTTDKAKTIQENTKSGLISISNSGAYVVSMMTGMSETDGNTDKNGTVYDKQSTVEDDLKAVENIFGTSTNPTVGKFYLVASADIESIVNNDILNDVIEKIQNPINTVKIVDYFPNDITKNFEFSYVGNPTIGTVSDTIDTETNTISWNIGTLKGDEVATLKYKLKLKDMNNKELLDKVISTNEKVVLTYNDNENKEYEAILESSPKIKLTEIKQNVNENNVEDNTTKKDNTIAKAELPNTGKIILMWIIGLVIFSGTVAHVRYKKLYK